jgi:hypothetical protein
MISDPDSYEQMTQVCDANHMISSGMSAAIASSAHLPGSNDSAALQPATKNQNPASGSGRFPLLPDFPSTC